MTEYTIEIESTAGVFLGADLLVDVAEALRNQPVLGPVVGADTERGVVDARFQVLALGIGPAVSTAEAAFSIALQAAGVSGRVGSVHATTEPVAA